MDWEQVYNNNSSPSLDNNSSPSVDNNSSPSVDNNSSPSVDNGSPSLPHPDEIKPAELSDASCNDKNVSDEHVSEVGVPGHHIIRRVLRKRIDNRIKMSVSKNRRCRMSPKQHNASSGSSDKSYLGMRYRKLNLKKLETIYEEPLLREGSTISFSAGAKERYINFEAFSRVKARKRLSNVKKLIGKKKRKTTPMTMDAFLKRLQNLMGPSNLEENEDVLTSFMNCTL